MGSLFIIRGSVIVIGKGECWKLWYNHPASEWEEALPIGNGRLGGMVFGGIEVDRIALNEDTLWAGFPRDTINYEARRHLKRVRELVNSGEVVEAQKLIESKMLGRDCEPYLPLGDLRITRLAGSTPYSQYSRELLLADGVATVTYQSDNEHVKVEYFASYPDQVIVVRYTAVTGELNLNVTLDSPLRFNTTADGHSLTMNGQAPSNISDNYLGDHPTSVICEDDLGLSFQARLYIDSDGSVIPDLNKLEVRAAKQVTIYLAAVTGFSGYNTNPDGNNLTEKCLNWLTNAASKGYEKVKQRHIQDHRRLFDRVELTFGGDSHMDSTELPTDERLIAYRETKNDLQLETLYFHYGRYLLMASSRPGTQPANLQGIWNPHVQPPWNSDYTVNINTQMNYWPAEVCNLSECHEPLFDMLEDLSGSGRRTAEIHYGARGWTTHHNVDLWRMTTPTGGSACWAFWPMGGAWLVRHLWDRYLFDGDIAFLRNRAYPLMKGAALFCLDWLIESPDGKWGTNPSTSPENTFLTADGQSCNVTHSSTMDIAIMRELFTYCLAALEVLHGDEAFQFELTSALVKLPEYQIGRHGQIQEWLEDYQESEPGHRHVSHLYGLYPGDQIHEGKQELFSAAATTLERRLAHGGGHTGWSCAWLINLFARLKDSEQAYQSIQTLLTHSTYPNLFDAHPPFQIDGNFGGIAGFAEMLLQSHLGFVELLPGLPLAWQEGRVSGLKARGGYTVGLEWKDGKLVQARIRASRAGTCKIRYNEKLAVQTLAGDSIEITNDEFVVAAGEEYNIRVI